MREDVHISNLKPYHGVEAIAPLLDDEYIAETLLNRRKRNNDWEYLISRQVVKWRGYPRPRAQDTWDPPSPASEERYAGRRPEVVQSGCRELRGATPCRRCSHPARLLAACGAGLTSPPRFWTCVRCARPSPRRAPLRCSNPRALRRHHLHPTLAMPAQSQPSAYRA